MNLNEVLKNQKLRLYFKIISSIILLYLVFYGLDINLIFKKFASLPRYIILILIIQTCLQLMVNVLIKRKMFAIFHYQEKFFSIYRKMFIGSFYGFFMPAMIGGDVYYTIHFGKKLKSYAKIMTGIFLIKLIGLTVFFSLSLIILIFFRNIIFPDLSLNIPRITEISFISIVLVAVGFLVFMTLSKIFYWQYRRIKEKLKVIKNDIIVNRYKVLLIILYSLIFYLVSIGGRVIIGKVIGINLPVIQLAAIIMMVNFLIIMPVSVSGIGVREVSYVTLMQLFNIDYSTALVMSFLDFSISLVAVSLGGLFVLIGNFKK